ncbi:MAG: glycosyl transferase family 9 [Melioribacteraceae bacterium]|nr:MAG: glycosyl transferase family 9 [Melioribacteraceae bacterium]
MFRGNAAPSILIVRPDRIGDVVLSTGFPRELKKHFPGCKVGVFVRDYTKELFLNNPHVDYILSKDDLIPGDKLSFKSIMKLRKLRFDISLTLLPEEKLNYLLFFAGIRLRIGVGHKFYQFITNVKSVYRRKYKPLRHEADFCADTLRKIGISEPDFTPEIYLSDIDKKYVDEQKPKLSAGKRLIGIHITSGGSAPNWKVDEYYALIEKLLTDERFAIMVTDNKLPDNFPFNGEVITPNVGLKLSESIKNFALPDLFLSASTGPAHICGALGVETVSLFCPLPACSPKLWSPLGNNSNNILPTKGYCEEKCPGDPKVCDFSGEGGIDSRQIFEVILEKSFG